MKGTYSPEDDKLRLYPDEGQRLPDDVYARVHAAGYGWAPMQKLFYAVWTPERADLLTELTGEIQDEETSLTERAETRAERFQEYKEKRAEEAESTRESVSQIVDLRNGSPIIIGHHSERAARKDQERIENGIKKAVQLWDTAKYWEDRARGAIRHAKYKQLPTVRARRIKRLEADQRKQQRKKNEAAFYLQAWSDPTEPLTMKKAKALTNYGHFDVTLSDGREVTAWGALDEGKITPEEVKAKVIPELTERVAWASRWISHYENRLAYEKILLGDSGGTAADRTKPEAGGACKCWASRGRWVYIQKVNKVSVSVLDNWGNGGENFKRNIALDQLSAVISKADVDAKRASGELVETDDKTGFYLNSPEPETQAPATPTPEQPKAPDQAQPFENLREQLKTGVTVVSAPDLFPTPPGLAAKMVELAHIRPMDRVLEPSAGTGNILREIVKHGAATIEAIEINYRLANMLKETYPAVRVACVDFLQHQDPEGYDKIIMNPPFTKGEDIKHIKHALELLRPNGRIIALAANGPRQNDTLRPLTQTWEELPEDTFKEEGTQVNAALLIIKKKEPKAIICETQTKLC